MRIGIDLTALSSESSSGVDTFSLGLTKGISCAANSDDKVIVLCREESEGYLKGELCGIGVSFMPIKPPFYPKPLLHAIKLFSWIIRCYRIRFYFEVLFRSKAARIIDSHMDALIIPTTKLNFYSLKIPTILCVHDIQHEYIPENFSIKERISRWVDYRLSCWASTSIQVSSDYVKDCLMETFRFVDERKIFLAYEGVDLERFRLDTNSVPNEEINWLEGKGFIFYPAQMWPHKNHSMLIKALEIFRDKNGYELPCVLTGKDFGIWGKLSKEITRSKLSNIYYLGLVDNDSLLWLYKNCLAVLALGLHESSSLPVREGAAFGKPILCSDIPPNIEASEFLRLILVDRFSPESLSINLDRLDKNDLRIKCEASENITLVKLFAWRMVAYKYMATINKWRISSS